MLTFFRARLRGGIAAAGRRVASPVAFALSRRPRRAAPPISVHMLVSGRTWHAGILAAISFEHFTGRRWELFVHEDGSVDAAARAEIERRLPGVRFVPRPEAEARIAEYLADAPRSRAQRAKWNMLLKLFDSLAFAPHERFIVLDSDVIFFRRPDEILDWADAGRDECWFNQDTKEVYCTSRARIEETFGFPMWDRVNSGLCLLTAAAFSREWSERFIAELEPVAEQPIFFEQTLFAFHASRQNRGGLLPRKYEISWGYLRAAGSVCRHYVGAFKHDLLYVEGAITLMVLLLRDRILGR